MKYFTAFILLFCGCYGHPYYLDDSVYSYEEISGDCGPLEDASVNNLAWNVHDTYASLGIELDCVVNGTGNRFVSCSSEDTQVDIVYEGMFVTMKSVGNVQCESKYRLRHVTR